MSLLGIYPGRPSLYFETKNAEQKLSEKTTKEWLNIWRNISSKHETRSVSSTDETLACILNRRFMSQVRRTRHFAWIARREEEKKIKRLLPVHCSGSSYVRRMNVALQLVHWWRVALARFWHVCLEQNGRDAVMFFWRCWWQSSSFTLKCSRNKGKTKEMFKCIAYCPF